VIDKKQVNAKTPHIPAPVFVCCQRGSTLASIPPVTDKNQADFDCSLTSKSLFEELPREGPCMDVVKRPAYWSLNRYQCEQLVTLLLGSIAKKTDILVIRAEQASKTNPDTAPNGRQDWTVSSLPT
jgi:hypothetical protein